MSILHQIFVRVSVFPYIAFLLESCYFYRMYYAREAYILSFEHSLCSFLSPNGKPHSRDFSDSLFLSTNWYANEEEYLMALRDQVLMR